MILATGGSAALWQRTTNPPGSLGIGLLLARGAGAALADLELMQFHPTAVTGIKGREGFLVTEAIRGEGATLLDARGERFVDELAPRDEVARAIWSKMAESGRPSVDLDMRAVDPLLFPNVVGALREAGLDPATELVPVAPAAHYGMGGIVADLDGATTVPGLYAVGESACTGLHGANRLASNSLSECFVFGARAALAALSEPRGAGAATRRRRPRSSRPARETRAALWRDAGLVRDAEGLQALADDPHPLARLIARHALLRTESRGAHTRSDFPATDPALDLPPLGHARRRGRARLRALGLSRRANTASSGERLRFLTRTQHCCVLTFTRAGHTRRWSRSTGEGQTGGHGRSSCTKSAGRSTESCRETSTAVETRTSRCFAHARRPSSGWSAIATTSRARRAICSRRSSPHFPMHAQPRVWRVVQGYVDCALDVLERMPQNGFDVHGQPLQCRATTRRGTPCQRMPLHHNGYCPSHQHLAETEEIELVGGASRWPSTLAGVARPKAVTGAERGRHLGSADAPRRRRGRHLHRCRPRRRAASCTRPRRRRRPTTSRAASWPPSSARSRPPAPAPATSRASPTA